MLCRPPEDGTMFVWLPAYLDVQGSPLKFRKWILYKKWALFISLWNNFQWCVLYHVRWLKPWVTWEISISTNKKTWLSSAPYYVDLVSYLSFCISRKWHQSTFNVKIVTNLFNTMTQQSEIAFINLTDSLFSIYLISMFLAPMSVR